MASETDPSFFIPFMLGLTSAGPPQETADPVAPRAPRDRIILINPFTQTMAVFETTNGPLGLVGDLLSSKSSQRPASKSSIENLPRVQISKGENDDVQCVVCLEELEDGDEAKEMPCKHRFHGECIERWLGINGCCPVCRHEMPADEDDDLRAKNGREGEIWVSLSFGGLRVSDNQENED